MHRLVAMLLAFSGCTTSGVEHTHSLQDHTFTKRRANLSVVAENSEMVVLGSSADKGDDLVVDLARAVWSKVHSGHRDSQSRSEAPKKRPPKTSSGTLEVFRAAPLRCDASQSLQSRNAVETLHFLDTHSSSCSAHLLNQDSVARVQVAN